MPTALDVAVLSPRASRYKVELAVELRPVEGELVERGKERETVARALASQLQAVQGSVRCEAAPQLPRSAQAKPWL